MKEFLPHEMLTHAQIYKYKFLIIPSCCIVLCFFLRDAFVGAQFLYFVVDRVHGAGAGSD